MFLVIERDVDMSSDTSRVTKLGAKIVGASGANVSPKRPRQYGQCAVPPVA